MSINLVGDRLRDILNPRLADQNRGQSLISHGGRGDTGNRALTPILRVEDLKTHFFTRAGVVRAVDGVSFEVRPGEVLGLVGESGCGKTVTGFSILGLVDPPGRIVGGRIIFDGTDLLQLGDARMRQIRGARIAMVFQDPMMTLNPVLRIDTQMVEAVRAHQHVDASTALPDCPRRARARRHPRPTRACAPTCISSAAGCASVAIAIALLNRPKLIIADEPTTALDVTIQAQILYEAQKLCRESGTALIWITHDSVVAGLADRICVMYAGRIVEQGSVDEVLDAPLHPYTHGLIGSVPSRNWRGAPLAQIPGMTPALINLPPGCAFRTRCPRAQARCTSSLNCKPITAAWCAASIRCEDPRARARLQALRAAARLRRQDRARARRRRGRRGGARGGRRLVLEEGEVVGLVGESGCGKSTLGAWSPASSSRAPARSPTGGRMRPR